MDPRPPLAASSEVCIRLEIGITDRVSGSDAHRLLQRFGPELYENRVRHWAQQMGFPFGPSVYMLICQV